MKRPPKKGTITEKPTVCRDGDTIIIDIPMALRHRNGHKEIILPPGVTPATESENIDTHEPISLSKRNLALAQTSFAN